MSSNRVGLLTPYSLKSTIEFCYSAKRRSLCYFVFSYPVYNPFTLLPCLFSYPVYKPFTLLPCLFPYPVYKLFTLLLCLLSTLFSVYTVLTMLFSQNEVSCHSCQPWSSLNSLVHSEVTLNVKSDSK